MSDLKGTYEYTNDIDVFTGDTISWVLDLRNESSTLTHTVLIDLLEPAALFGQTFTTSAFTYTGSAGVNGARHDLTPGDSLSVTLSVVAPDVDEKAVTSVARISEAQAVIQLRVSPAASVTPDDEFFDIAPDGPVLINHHNKDRMVTTDFPARVKAWQQGTGDDWARAQMDDSALSGSSFTEYLSSLAVATGEVFTTADETKLDGIEAGADVTDATNVAAAGGFMASGVSAFGASLVDDADAAAARATLGAADSTTVFNLGSDVSGNWARLNAIDTVQATQNTDIGTNTTKLAGIEAGADVTDSTNVSSSGAFMASGVSAFGATLVDDADAATALATLGALDKTLIPTEVMTAASDEITAIVTATDVMQFRMPYAMTGTSVRVSLGSACSTGTFTVDVNVGGATVLSTKVTVDATEKTSTTAAIPAVLSVTAWADDAIVTIDVDNQGDGTATGLKVTMIGTRSA
jgi:uncharacterized protein YaaQ